MLGFDINLIRKNFIIPNGDGIQILPPHLAVADHKQLDFVTYNAIKRSLRSEYDRLISDSAWRDIDIKKSAR